MDETVFVNHVKASLDAAEYNFSKISKEIINLPGSSGTKTRHFLNNLVQMNLAKYLEIGVGGGSLTCSAMYNNTAKIFCVDNWSDCPKDAFMENYKKFKGNNYTKIFDQSYKSLDTKKISKFNMLLYDATTDYYDVLGALPHFINSMEDVFVYIVDDINWRYIHEAAKKSIQDLNLTILFEKEIFLTQDNTHTPMHIARDSWWNGLYIVVLKKPDSKPKDDPLVWNEFLEL
jgi:precorrin-6B methylase 2